MKTMLISLVLVLTSCATTNSDSARRANGSEDLEMIWVCDVAILQYRDAAFEVDSSTWDTVGPELVELEEGQNWYGNCTFHVEQGRIVNADRMEAVPYRAVQKRFTRITSNREQ